MNNTGSIDYSEFLIAAVDRKKLINDSNLAQAFQQYDKEDSGYITRAGLQNTIGAGRSISVDAWEQIMREADQSGSGSIHFDQFQAMMMKLVK